MGKMIAYCVLDCGKCDAYLATLNNDEVLREKTAKAWAELNNVPIQPKDLHIRESVTYYTTRTISDLLMMR